MTRVPGKPAFGFLGWDDARCRQSPQFLRPSADPVDSRDLRLFAVTNSYSHQPQLPRNPLHRLNAERDVFFQVDAQIGGAVD